MELTPNERASYGEQPVSEGANLLPSVLAYHRPTTLDEAVALLAEPRRRAIGGGTVAVPEGRIATAAGVELVDLQALGLDAVSIEGDRLVIGAMVRLGDLAGTSTPTNPDIPEVPELISDLARRELPSTLRNQATIGGTVALGDGDSLLLAGLLVHGAMVHLHGQAPMPLEQSLEECVGARIVTAVSIELDDRSSDHVSAEGASSEGGSAVAGTGRTPADTPIVAAVARRSGEVTRVALTGMAPSPILVDPADPIVGLEPPGDFRGSTSYRQHLATTLTTRVLGELA